MRADEVEIGPSPYEYVMAGLGACTAMTLRMYADRHGWPLGKISVEVRHKIVMPSDGKTSIDHLERIIHVTDLRRTRTALLQMWGPHLQ